MGQFKSLRQAQRFLAAHDQISTIFVAAAIAFPLFLIATPELVHPTCGTEIQPNYRSECADYPKLLSKSGKSAMPLRAWTGF